MTEPLRAKKEVWKEAHAQRTQCPKCGRYVALRCLRWRHACTERKPPVRLLTADVAELRRQELRQRALEALNLRPQGSAGQTDSGAA